MLGGHVGIRQENKTTWILCLIVQSFRQVCYYVENAKFANSMVDFRNNGSYL